MWTLVYKNGTFSRLVSERMQCEIYNLTLDAGLTVVLYQHCHYSLRLKFCLQLN